MGHRGALRALLLAVENKKSPIRNICFVFWHNFVQHFVSTHFICEPQKGIFDVHRTHILLSHLRLRLA